MWSPFVPLGDATMDACVELARSVGETVARRFGLPVYLYEHASRPGVHRRLEEIRRGGLAALASSHDRSGLAAGLRSLVAAPDRRRDRDRRPSAARGLQRRTRDGPPRDRARPSRGQYGRAPADCSSVKAIGIALADRGIVQVSMNLTDFRTTSILEAFDAVEVSARIARDFGHRQRARRPRTRRRTHPASRGPRQAPRLRRDRMVLERRLDAVTARRADVARSERRILGAIALCPLPSALLGLFPLADGRHAERAHLLVQIAALEAERVGRARDVAVERRQSALDVLALPGVARVEERL